MRIRKQAWGIGLLGIILIGLFQNCSQSSPEKPYQIFDFSSFKLTNDILLNTYAKSSTISEGMSIQLSVTAGSATNKPLSYKWTKAGTPIGGNSSTHSILAATMDDAGVYTVEISNDVDKTRADIVLTVLPPPVGSTPTPTPIPISQAFVLYQNDYTTKNINRDGGTPKPNGSNALFSIAIQNDPNDGMKRKLLVVDRGNHRVLIYNAIPLNGNAMPDVVVGQTDFVSGLQNAGQGATNAVGFSDPVGIGICENNGMMMVSDRVNNRVLVWNSIPKTNGQPASFVIGQTNLNGNTAATSPNGLQGPYWATCIQNKLFVTDKGNNRVLIYNAIPSASNPAANIVIGQPDMFSNFPGCAADRLNGSYELAYQNNRLYIVDGLNHRVLAYNGIPTVSGAMANVVIGQPSFDFCGLNRGNGSVASANSLNNPNSLAFKGNRLAIGDHFNHRVLFFNLPLTNDAPAVMVMGQPDFNTSTEVVPPTSTSITGVKGLIFETTSNFMWLGEANAHRLRVTAAPF